MNEGKKDETKKIMKRIYINQADKMIEEQETMKLYSWLLFIREFRKEGV